MVKKNNYKKDVYQNMTLIMQLAIHMMTPIFLCLAIGFHWHSVLIFLLLGILAGGKNMYRLAMGTVKKEEKENKKDGN